MEFLASESSYENDDCSKLVWDRLSKHINSFDGICYYKHPIITSATDSVPDLIFLAQNLHPVALKCYNFGIHEISQISDDSWIVAEREIDSPLLELEDYAIGLKHRFESERILRYRFDPICGLILPHISKHEFELKFKIDPHPRIKIIWSDLIVTDLLDELSERLSETDWLLSKSVFQGISPLNHNPRKEERTANQKGEAILILERQIALLDQEQHKVAIQIPPGPQRIRGLAGTGKTVVLAMKAANIHRRYPNKKILFTFNTQSLYNQTKKLITKFFRIYSDEDPNWDFLHVRHAWGGQRRPGVYYDTCRMVGISPLTFSEAKYLKSSNNPFRACCTQLLEEKIQPYYNFILVDEAQDFPDEFFRVLYNLATENKAIYWAYDELQSLWSREIPSPTRQFGTDKDGNPLITLDGPDYPGGIEKDFVLKRSYRCPHNVLMLAHGIGLGINSPSGCQQMLDKASSWRALGYEIEHGNFHEGDEMVIFRPPENSPNRINELYKGDDPFIRFHIFNERSEELIAVAHSIVKDIKEDGVKPEDIVIISLSSRYAKDYLTTVQQYLMEKEIISTIPGLIDDSWEFAEPNSVTLSTVFRAKGNETPVVYIIAFDTLYSYIEEVESRNCAFTSLSRAKGWVRIYGSGDRMKIAEREISILLNNFPYFKFTFPNMDNIRRLDASETTRRRKEVRKAQESIRKLVEVEKDALTEIDKELLGKLKDMLRDLKDEDK